MEGMDLTGKKIAILVDTMYQEMEVWYPLYRFQEAGATVITIGAKAGETYGSKLGYPVKSQLSYDEARMKYALSRPVNSGSALSIGFSRPTAPAYHLMR